MTSTDRDIEREFRRDLILSDLLTLRGITAYCGGVMAECAIICLRESGHQCGVRLLAVGLVEEELPLRWHDPPGDDYAKMLRSYSPHRATEDAACGVAILLMRRLTGHEVVATSWIGTGFDYWLGEDTDLPFQQKARLEVAGLRAGSRTEVETLVARKKAQTERSDALGLPAYVVVVAFCDPLAYVVRR